MSLELAYSTCEETSKALKMVRSTVSTNTEVGLSLDAYWGLQDSLFRFLDALSDHPEQANSVLQERWPDLRDDVEQVVKAAGAAHLMRNSGIRRACHRIKLSLTEINNLASSEKGKSAMRTKSAAAAN